MDLNAAGAVQVSERMIGFMRTIRPWTKFLAILGFVGTVFMMAVGAGIMVFANMFPNVKNAPPSLFGFLYILFSVVYFMPSYYLYKYSSSLAQFLKSNASIDLESAMSYQKSFWKFVGIIVLVGLVVAVLGIAAAILIPMLAQMRMQQAV